MKRTFKTVEGGVVAAEGFRAGGVFCDIKRLGTGKGSAKGPKRDLALLVAEVPCAVAGMFTTNQVCAAPVKVCVPRVAKGIAQAVVVNSGNANACTGRAGMRDALAMTRLAERALAIGDGRALVASTGRIGVILPVPQVARGIVA
ncbi:MAG: bifunctional ornithine acetyltransferase/N-acetylglutamate synthase, partial [Verrucomicrobia bacterium]|nr:bifunctional ornithine acetyltransferase/N-acetylglutamate synthase [Verrucomicrobiota bacterium]